ncbi:acyltransferase [Phocaeicola sp.]
MKISDFIFAIPKSIYVCMKLLPFKQAIKLPIVVNSRCKILSLKGKCIITSPISLGLVKIGFNEIGLFDKKYATTILQIDGTLVFKGRARINYNSKIIIGQQGTLEIGSNFDNSAGISIVCWNKIVIGNNVLTSWEILMMDTDFHSTICTDTKHMNEQTGCIEIVGDNVWIGNRAMLLKGTKIPNGSIIGAMSLVNKVFLDENCLLAGNPAHICKKHITLCRE